MALGIVSSADFEKELGSLNDSKEQRAQVIQSPNPGRKAGDVNVPTPLRKIIADTAIEEGSKEANHLAEKFGISSSSVSAYKNGATSTTSYDSPNPALRSHINGTKNAIVERAQSRLKKAISHITDEKLADAKVRDLAGIAKDLAAVVKVMEPEVPKVEASNRPTFIIYNPPQKKEESFETIVLKE